SPPRTSTSGPSPARQYRSWPLAVCRKDGIATFASFPAGTCLRPAKRRSGRRLQLIVRIGLDFPIYVAGDELELGRKLGCPGAFVLAHHRLVLRRVQRRGIE